jgi:hypothetical protein
MRAWKSNRQVKSKLQRQKGIRSEKEREGRFKPSTFRIQVLRAASAPTYSARGMKRNGVVCRSIAHRRSIHLQTETMPHIDLLRFTSLHCKRTVDNRTEMRYEPPDEITDLMLAVSAGCEFGFVSGSEHQWLPATFHPVPRSGEHYNGLFSHAGGPTARVNTFWKAPIATGSLAPTELTTRYNCYRGTMQFT